MPETSSSDGNSGYGFPRAKRLLNAGEYQTVLDGSRYKVGHSGLLLLATPNSLDHPRLGLVVAKKNVRRAVDRNKVKRAARQAFRLSQHQIGSVDVVFLARRGIGELDSGQLRKLFADTFARLARKLAKDSAASAGVSAKKSAGQPPCAG